MWRPVPAALVAPLGIDRGIWEPPMLRTRAPHRLWCTMAIVRKLSVIVVAFVSVAFGAGCRGPDFDTWREAGEQLVNESGGSVDRIEVLENDGGTMYDDSTSHVEVFATLEGSLGDGTQAVRSAGERLGYAVSGDPVVNRDDGSQLQSLAMTRDGSRLDINIVHAGSGSPLEVTIASVDCDCPGVGEGR